MPGSSLGAGYAHAGESISEGIMAAAKAFHEDHQRTDKAQQQVQGILDAAKTIQINDPKTGKPKPFFSPEQVQTVQHLLDTHKAYQAGALAAGMGMSANAIARIRQQQAMESNAMQGPVTAKDKYGISQYNPHSGAWTRIVPRDPETGLSSNETKNFTQKAQAQELRARAAKQKEFDNTLKDAGISKSKLFDPHQIELGKQVGGQFFVPGQEDPNTKTIPFPQTDPKTGAFDKNQATSIRVGYRAPVFPTDPDGNPDRTLPPVDKGSPGKIMTPNEFKAYQNQAISMADPLYSTALATQEQAAKNPNDPQWQQRAQHANDYVQSAQKILMGDTTNNPEYDAYRRKVLSSTATSATDQSSQMGNVAPSAVESTQQSDQVAPPPPEEDTPDE